LILNYKGIPVFYSQTGKGESVVLLHGFLESSSMWNELIPIISVNHQIISVDLLAMVNLDV
jgi:pimeloyl-ACP methyl ester carboxylesterase